MASALLDLGSSPLSLHVLLSNIDCPASSHFLTMAAEDRIRSSVDSARDPAQPVLPVVERFDVQTPQPPKPALHPAVYIS